MGSDLLGVQRPVRQLKKIVKKNLAFR